MYKFTKIFVLILCAILSLVTITRAIGSTGDDNGGNSTRAHELVARAKQLLEGGVRNGKDSKRAFDLLIAASGIDRIYIDKRNNSDNNDISLIFADDVVIQWRTAVERHIEAVRTLVDLFWSGDGAPLNPAIAHRLVIELADGGDSGAQVELGVLLASGIRPVAVMGPKKAVKASGVNYFVLGQPDVPKALVHYYFAARGGDALAQMALGYRHLYGLGVPQSCPTAAKYYNAVAERVIDMAKRPESLPTTRTLRLSHKTVHSKKPKPTAEQEFLHYQWFADYGHAEAARAVAHLLSHGADRDYKKAVGYLLQAAEAGDAGAMAHMGHMYANGLAVPQDFDKAREWFWRAGELGHPSGFFGLGFTHLTGQGADIDFKQAFVYFRRAVETGQEWSGLGDGFLFLGMMYMKGIGVQSDINQAIAAFAASSKLGNLLAGYNLAVLHLQGAVGEAKGSKSACRAAVSQLKRVAERGWATLTHAAEQFGAGEYELSLFNHMRAAEYGYEIGQSNAAWMLLEGYGYPTGSEFGGSVAVTLLSRAAEQGNSAALVRVGDSFWYGNGVSRDWARAARVYTEAARHRVPQAIFNLAYMHQHGAGVTKDLHLAKRYYDRVSEVSQESQAVANIALIGLRLQTWWENVSRKLPSGFARTGNGIVSMALFAPLQTVQLQDKDVLPVSGRKVRRGKANWFGMQSVLDVMDSIGDSLDVTLALWIAAALALVLWRRRMLRHRGLDQQDEVNNPGRNQN